MDRGYLRLARSNRHRRFGIHLLDLVIDTLHHGLVGAVLLFEYFDKLFASDIVG